MARNGASPPAERDRSGKAVAAPGKSPAAPAQASQSAGLPAEVTRPLRWGVAAICGFLALILGWSAAAPLATSIHASGHLMSRLPNFEIQHGYGGEIAHVGVRADTPVEAGQLLFRLDTRVEAATRREIAAQLARLEEESAVIRARMDGGGSAPTGEIADRYAQEAEVARLRRASLEEGAEAMEIQASAAHSEAGYLARRLDLLEGREEKQRLLLARGLTRETEVDRITEQVLSVAGAREQKEASAASLQQQAAKARADALSIGLEQAAAHLRQLQQNEAQASQLRRELARLDAMIAAAEITAPVAGHVQELRFDSTRMYAPRGQTLAVIAQRLEAPYVRLTIPTDTIDQVAVGMRGKLTINGLPQREIPPLHITLTALSPEAAKDGEARALGYTATAEIDPADLEAAQASLQSRLRLAADMPVSATLSGRQITLLRYLTQPFTSAFEGALQD